jgi:hypothetical protein
VFARHLRKANNRIGTSEFARKKRSSVLVKDAGKTFTGSTLHETWPEEQRAWRAYCSRVRPASILTATVTTESQRVVSTAQIAKRKDCLWRNGMPGSPPDGKLSRQSVRSTDYMQFQTCKTNRNLFQLYAAQSIALSQWQSTYTSKKQKHSSQ